MISPHIRTTSIIEYSNYPFSGSYVEQLASYLRNNDVDIYDEFSDDWELEVTQVQQLVNELEKEDSSNICFENITVEDMLKFLKYCLECNQNGKFTDNEYIYIDWF